MKSLRIPDVDVWMAILLADTFIDPQLKTGGHQTCLCERILPVYTIRRAAIIALRLSLG
jgi:hypothetical protein